VVAISSFAERKRRTRSNSKSRQSSFTFGGNQALESGSVTKGERDPGRRIRERRHLRWRKDRERE